MKSPSIILHRGYLVSGENALMSILFPLSRGAWVGCDLIYFQKNWRLSRDWSSLNPHSEYIDVFIDIIQRHSHLFKGRLLVDVRWDLVKNRDDDVDTAMATLNRLFTPFLDRVWIQVSHRDHLNYFDKSWTRGISWFGSSHDILPDCEFLTLDLSNTTPLDLVNLSSTSKKLIGTTCKKPSCSTRYTHLYPFLHALIYEVSDMRCSSSV